MIAKKDIKKAVSECFVSSDIRVIKPFTKGNINQLFEVCFNKGKSILLRVYNELWKADKEAFVYRDISAHVDVPVPEIYYADSTLQKVPFGFTLMSKLPGQRIDKSYRKYGNKKLYQEAGEMLSKIHSINFSSFGWIMGNKIEPAFTSWKNFFWHDIDLKMKRLKSLSLVRGLLPQVEKELNLLSPYLTIYQKPCLVHKDYHASHILTDKKKVTGVLDVEWAIAGHNENDFIKMELWNLKNKQLRKEFFLGYEKNGYISGDYIERKKLYHLWHCISMINISLEVKKNEWLRHNCLEMKKTVGK